MSNSKTVYKVVVGSAINTIEELIVERTTTKCIYAKDTLGKTNKFRTENLDHICIYHKQYGHKVCHTFDKELAESKKIEMEEVFGGASKDLSIEGKMVWRIVCGPETNEVQALKVVVNKPAMYRVEAEYEGPRNRVKKAELGMIKTAHAFPDHLICYVDDETEVVEKVVEIKQKAAEAMNAQIEYLQKMVEQVQSTDFDEVGYDNGEVPEDVEEIDEDYEEDEANMELEDMTNGNME